MSNEKLFTIDIKKLDNPFEREKFLMLPKDLLVELLVRHLKKEIKVIEYLKQESWRSIDYGDDVVGSKELLEILGEKENVKNKR